MKAFSWISWVMAFCLLAGCGAQDGPDYTPWDGISDPTGDVLEEDPWADWDYTPPSDVTDTSTDVVVPPGCPEKSYIWIANSAEGTLSKLCTITGEEMGRYYTSEQESSGDPSRTSVNLHGDMVVTNRDPSTGPSSVTKFAADISECVDRNGDGEIQTSMGGDDVLPFGEDECMIWNTPLGNPSASTGCRATAWEGNEDPDTGMGGNVWIGCMNNQTVYVLDGDTGALLDQAPAGIGTYGGAMDGRGSFWTVAMGCTVGLCRLSRMDMATMTHEIVNVPCGYGISVDRLGRVWTAGLGCINRHDPETGENRTFNAGFSQFHRGIAVDDAGSVWAAVTHGDVVRISEDSVGLIHQFAAGPADIVGVAIDHQGFVWAVSQGGNAALKINPSTYEVESFPIGMGPYTYSDMTGYQLSIVEIPI